MTGRVDEVLAAKDLTIETTHPRETVRAAVEHLNAFKIGALLVIDGERPLGIITERDVLTRVIARGLAPETALVGEVMTRLLATIEPDTTIADALTMMAAHHCRHLPVVHADRVFGLLSIGDLTDWLVRDQRRTIEDLHDFICHA